MRHGVPVAAPIRGRDGRFEQIAEAADGERGALLFTFAAGRPFQACPADAAANGETLARVHVVSESFAGTGARPALDLDRLLDRPVTALLSLVDDRPDAHAAITRLADRLRVYIAELAPQLTRGYCHGDCHGYNAHFGDDGMATFFDFDDGGPGWFAYDLSVFLWSAYISGNAERRALWRHFLSGYARRRRVASTDLDAVPLFIAIRHFWLLGEYAAGAEVWGTAWMGEWFDRQLAFLRHWQDEQLADPLGLGCVLIKA
jgi:Ser/Thr protein kinase RdoA (MazF antagonist)